MANIKINNKKDLKGHLTAQTRANSAGNLILVGELYLHNYIDHIKQIETDRYLLKDVSVTGFAIGSNDYFIKYEFECKVDSLVFKGGESNLTESEMSKIEKDIFAHEKDELFHKNNNPSKTI